MGRGRREKDERRTRELVEEYRVLEGLLRTWEGRGVDEQVEEAEYISGLRKRVRRVRGYLEHRSVETV